MEDFFFDYPTIGDGFRAVTTLNGEPIGFASWGPRGLPDRDNCVITARKGKGNRTMRDSSSGFCSVSRVGGPCRLAAQPTISSSFSPTTRYPGK